MKRFLRFTTTHNLWGSLLIVVAISAVLTLQIGDRHHFANSELHDDVAQRWGAPIEQPSPSVRFVPSGTVFNELLPLPLASQHVTVWATMNYRKRGLVYFSGFDFRFAADYVVRNDRDADVDAVFIFPVNLEKNRVLLSDLVFAVDGQAASAQLRDDKLVWTGRIAQGGQVSFHVAFSGRGLDSLRYRLDPQAPVRDFRFDVAIRGGVNFDYPEGVVPAHTAQAQGDTVDLHWAYASLESGVPIGVILPGEQAWDSIIVTLCRRAWAPFLLVLAGLTALALRAGRPLRFYESYLVAVGYCLFFVLTAYFAAFMSFHAAWPLAFAIVSTLLVAYLRTLLGNWATPWLGALLAAFLLVPTLAVLLEGYTGLIYTLELLSLVVTLMALTTRPSVREFVDQAFAGETHVA